MSKQRRLKTCFGRRAVRVLLIVLGAFLALAGANCERRSVADSAITAIVKSKLAADNETSSANINVDTKGGVVTLTGVVTTQANKEQAERIAMSAEGVTRVLNNITVETEGEHDAAGAGMSASDLEILSKIKTRYVAEDVIGA
jgi:hyperosmotically inducible protein